MVEFEFELTRGNDTSGSRAAVRQLRSRMVICGAAISLLAGCATELALTDRFVERARVAYSGESGLACTNSLLETAEFAVRDDRRHDVPPCRHVRWIDVEGTVNFRDIGGWTGLRTGRAYRGAEANCHTNPANFASWQKKSHELFVTARGARTLAEELGIRTELDLRNAWESPTPDVSPVPGAKLVRLSCGSYTNFLGDTALAAKILRAFADERNYPIYFHCFGGADRTGSVAFLVEGLCGVSEPDLSIDFELTSFSRIGKRLRRDYDEGARHPRFASMLAAIKRRPGATLAEKFADYAVNACGLTPDEVKAIRRNLRPDCERSETEVVARTPCGEEEVTRP